MPKRLFLLGLGVEPLEHATIEVLQAAGECDALFTHGLGAAHARFLARFSRKGVKARRLPEAPEEALWAGKIAMELAQGKTVGLVTLGHPFFWSALAGRLVIEGEKEGLPWQTFGAVSPMGLALSVSGVTLGTNVHGMQAFDAGSLARLDAKINLAWPLVLYFYSPLSPQDFGAAAGRLRALYGAEHPVLWCAASGKPRVTTVASLAGRQGELAARPVLYLAAKLESKSRLGRTDDRPMQGEGRKAPAWVKQ